MCLLPTERVSCNSLRETIQHDFSLTLELKSLRQQLRQSTSIWTPQSQNFIKIKMPFHLASSFLLPQGYTGNLSMLRCSIWATYLIKHCNWRSYSIWLPWSQCVSVGILEINPKMLFVHFFFFFLKFQKELSPIRSLRAWTHNLLTVVACTSGNLMIQEKHRFSFKKIGWCHIGPRN